MTRRIASFLTPRIAERMRAHIVANGRLPGDDCPCFDCRLTLEEIAAEQAALCLECGDAGFVRLGVPLGHPEFGRKQECRTCTTPEARLTRLVHDTGIPVALAKDYTYARADAGSKLRISIDEWLATRDQLPWALMLGDKGQGKTHCLVAICLRELEMGGRAWFTTVPELMAQLRPGGQDQDLRQTMLMRRLFDPGLLLALDDLGAEKPSEWVEEQLYRVVNHRYNQRAATIVSANLSHGVIPEGRVWDRVYGDLSYVGHLTGQSRRTTAPSRSMWGGRWQASGQE